MTKADSSSKRSSVLGNSSGSGHPRGRGRYVQQACGVCRQKKTRCDGQRPVCEACVASGRSGECTWTKEAPVHKPRTEAHFEALQKRNDALREYSAFLESLLDKCRREHGGDASDATFSYLQFRPAEDGFDISLDDIDYTQYHAEQDDSGSDVPSDSIQGLISPVQRLTLGDEGLLLLHGTTSVFRYGQIPYTNLPSRFPAIAENPDATYVLIIDGVDESHYNPSFDWSRHLPTSVPLDRKSHDKALDMLFKFFTSWCLRVIPALFLRDMYRALSVPSSQTPPKTPHYSPMLHNALIALGAAFLDDPAIRDYKSRQYFANAAKSYIEAECQRPNLSVVNALSILGSFHSSQGDQTLGFMYFGMSARMSQALGLAVDCSEWVKIGLIEEPDMLDRHWTHWTILTQDVCWSLYVGRDFCVRAPSESELKDIPVPFVDSEFDQMLWYHAPSGVAPQPNFLSKTFAATCELMWIARRIMDVINGLSKAKGRVSVIDELISDVDLKLNTWKGSLPLDVDITIKSRPTATPHKLMLHLAYWWLFILLHRPFFHRKAKVIHSCDREIDHVKLCKRAADNIMELLGTWRSLYTLRYVPVTLVQTVFSAGTIYFLAAVQATSGVRVAQKELKQSLDRLKLNLQYLNEIGKSWQCATNIAAILQGLMQDQLKPLLERRKLQINVTSHHRRSQSDGDSVYKSTPPASKASVSRRQSGSTRKPRSRQPSNATYSPNNNGTSPLDSPTIAVHPAPNDMLAPPPFQGYPSSATIQPPTSPSSVSNYTTEQGDLLQPWTYHPSGALPSSPITIVRRPSSSNSSSPFSSPVDIPIPIPSSPSRSSRSVSFPRHSPSQSLDISASGSFPHRLLRQPSAQSLDGSPSSSFPPTLSHQPCDPVHVQSHLFRSSETTQAGLFGMSEHPPQDYPSLEMSGFQAMLGGQTLPETPFVGPFSIGESIGSLQVSSDSLDFDMASFDQMDAGFGTGNSNAFLLADDLSTSPSTSFAYGSSFEMSGHHRRYEEMSINALEDFMQQFE